MVRPDPLLGQASRNASATAVSTEDRDHDRRTIAGSGAANDFNEMAVELARSAGKLRAHRRLKPFSRPQVAELVEGQRPGKAAGQHRAEVA